MSLQNSRGQLSPTYLYSSSSLLLLIGCLKASFCNEKQHVSPSKPHVFILLFSIFSWAKIQFLIENTHVLPCFTQLSTSKVTPSQLFRWNPEACPCGPCGPCGPGEQCSELESRGRGVQERHSIVEASASAPVEGQPAWFFRRLPGFRHVFGLNHHVKLC